MQLKSRNDANNVINQSSELDEKIVDIVNTFYANPIKTDERQNTYDIRGSSLERGEALTLAQLVSYYSPATSLEIGLASGASCIAISAARKHLGLNAKHIALDPYQAILSGSVGLLEIAKAGLREYVDWFPERSENFLNAASDRGEKYDFMFVDGGHDIGQTVTDAFYVHKTLNPGGIVVFHDGYLFSTAAAVRYLALECGYSILPLQPDSPIKVLGRILHYIPTLGAWYSTTAIPKMHRSLVALQRNK